MTANSIPRAARVVAGDQGALKMAPPPRRSRRLALKRITIGDLPEPALRRILLGPSDNLLRFVAACARV